MGVENTDKVSSVLVVFLGCLENEDEQANFEGAQGVESFDLVVDAEEVGVPLQKEEVNEGFLDLILEVSLDVLLEELAVLQVDEEVELVGDVLAQIFQLFRLSSLVPVS